MAVMVIEWDGNRVPEGLRKLPSGRYVIKSIDESPQLTEAEEADIPAALDELDAGGGISLADCCV